MESIPSLSASGLGLGCSDASPSMQPDATKRGAPADKRPVSRPARAAARLEAARTAAAAEVSAMSELTHQQLHAINLLLLGQDSETVARQVGVSRCTVWRWRSHHPAFVARLNQRRTELWGKAGDRLRNMLDEAVDVIAEQLRDGFEQTQFRAAKLLLTMAGAREMFLPSRPRPTEPADVIDEFARQRRDSHEVTDDERDAAERELARRVAMVEPEEVVGDAE